MNHHKMHPYNMHRPDQQPENIQPQQHGEPDLETPIQFEQGLEQEPDKDLPAQEPPEQAAASEAAMAEINEMRLRMAADMENFKKRLTREHQEQMRYASEKVLSDLLPALDNLDLALQYGATHEACKDMMQGIEMTRKQLLEAVAKNGLVSVGEAGEAFNPAIHEAIGMDPNPDMENGAVTRVLQRGYKLHERLLRPAKVMVNH